LQNVLVTSRPLDPEMTEYLREYPDLKVVESNLDPELYRQFALPGQAEVGTSPRLYLVDPDQNLMMHYPAAHDQNQVLEDIKKLMKLSQIG
jgi:hypothetical protein